MTTTTLAGAGIAVRDATPADNAGLLRLAAACPMNGDIGLCVHREPDFFALNRLEGERWRVGVVDADDGGIAGCVAVSQRHVWLNGCPARIAYVGDLKVAPAHRRGRLADALTEYAREACREIGGDDVPVLITVLGGNAAMERRMAGPRGLPCFTRFATVRTYSIPLLWRRHGSAAGMHIVRAAATDVPEMADLWRTVAAGRQLAPLFTTEGMRNFWALAPELDVSAYLLARDAHGRLCGFLGVWDQSSFKQLRVTRYSPRLAAVRRLFNTCAPLFGAVRLPNVGNVLRCASVVNICVPGGRTGVLRALLLEACSGSRRRGLSIVNVGLDPRDPLAAALRGLAAQPTDVHAYVTTPRGWYDGPPLGDRPLHYEVALV